MVYYKHSINGGGVLRKKVISSFLVFCLILVFSVNVSADSISDAKKKLEQQQNKYDSMKSSIDSNNLNIDKLQQIVEELDNNISILANKISDTQSQINSKEKDIKNSQNEIDRLVKTLQDKQALLDERVRAMYINGDYSYVSFILDSKDFSDLISRMDIVKKIVSFDKEAIQELNNSRKQIEDKQKVLEKEKTDLVSAKTDLVKQEADIAVQEKEQQKNLDNLSAVQNQLQDNQAQYKQKIADTKKRIADLIQAQKVTQSSPSRGGNVVLNRGSLSSGNAVIVYAYRFLGTPYAWGANGPNYFDCSGFVKYVYAHFGINLPRTTYTQIKVGQAVSKSNLRPGDLVFFGTPSSPHHVGIYCGNDTYIHAPKTGDVVKISVLSTRSDFAGARRVY
jgi:peptidoglycan DL-endopeptidase CwlO